MGVIQTGDSSGCLSLATARHPPLALKDFTAKTTLSDGHTIIKLDNGDLGLFFSKAITTRSDKELTSKWLQHSFQHSSNVLNFSSSAGLTIMCGAHLHCRAIVEYGDVTLAEIIKEKDSNREKGTSFDQSLLALSQDRRDGKDISVNPLQFVKFLFEVTEEIFNFSGQWITFHTTNLVFFKKLSRFKYLFLPEFESFHEREAFFDPDRISLGKQSESTTIFSIGMVLMSLLLNEDCSDCYDFHSSTFCWSEFEQKKERIQEMENQISLSDCSLGPVGYSIDESMAALTLAAFLSAESRPSFSQFKQKYFRILRKMSTNGENEVKVSAKLEEALKASKLRNSRLIKRTIPRRFGEGQDQNCNIQNLKTSNIIFETPLGSKRQKSRGRGVESWKRGENPKLL